MKKKLTAALATMCLSYSSSHALELPKGAKPVSDAGAIGIFVNRKLKITIYNRKTGKKIGTGTLHHRNDGVKAVNIVVNGKRIKQNLKWQIKGGKLCAGSISAKGKTVCGSEGLYQKGNQCYFAPNGKRVGTSFNC